MDFGRVNGNLALSRAIGDFEFKKSADLPPESQIVTAFPDVTIHEITDDDEFIVVACDGKSIKQTINGTKGLRTLIRHLGLPIIAGRRRICEARYSCQARAFSDLREYDG